MQRCETSPKLADISQQVDTISLHLKLTGISQQVEATLLLLKLADISQQVDTISLHLTREIYDDSITAVIDYALVEQ